METKTTFDLAIGTCMVAIILASTLVLKYTNDQKIKETQCYERQPKFRASMVLFVKSGFYKEHSGRVTGYSNKYKNGICSTHYNINIDQIPYGEYSLAVINPTFEITMIETNLGYNGGNQIGHVNDLIKPPSPWSIMKTRNKEYENEK